MIPISEKPQTKIVPRFDLKRKLGVLESAFEQFQLPTQADSATGKRLAALRDFAAATQPIPEEAGFLPLTGEGLWLSDIFEQLSGLIQPDDHCKRLRAAKTFDAAYVELLTGCLLKMGGGEVELKGADVHVGLEGKRISLACKRVTTLKQLIPRCREARDQIINDGVPGVGIIDVTYLIGAGSSWSYGDVAQANRDLLVPVLREIHSHLIGRPLIRALIFMNQHHAITLESENGETFFRGNTLLHFGKVDLAKSEEAELVASCLERALPTNE